LTMSSDYYERLGVRRDASADEIKRAYRALARRYHPDANSGSPEAEERFKEINEAYEVLSDPERRRRYDMFGPAGVGARGGAPSDSFGFGFGDIFDAFFSGSGFGSSGFSGRPGGRFDGSTAGEDISIDVHLDFVDAVFGTERTLQLRVQEPCERCEASGAEPGTHPTVCTSCGGHGKVQQVRRTVLGNLVTQFPCPDCGGVGRRIEHPCKECRAEGRRPSVVDVDIVFPAGVDNGAQLRLRGRGSAGRRGGPSGDLVVRVRVGGAPPGWSRAGNDLKYTIDVPVTTAALGGRLAFTTLEDEDVEIIVKPGTRTGTTMKLRGKGVPHLRNSGRGDLIVQLDVATPTDLTAEQEDLLRRLAALRGENVDAPGVVERIKNAFR
jgi:molecular chaperone DnaJ